MGTLARPPRPGTASLPPEWRLHFLAWIIQKVMFLRDKDWAQVVKTNHFPLVTILLWGT